MGFYSKTETKSHKILTFNNSRSPHGNWLRSNTTYFKLDAAIYHLIYASNDAHH